MLEISPKLHQQCVQILCECDEFKDYTTLNNFFGVTPRLSYLYNRLVQPLPPTRLMDAAMILLRTKSSMLGEWALHVVVQELDGRYDSNDGLHGRIQELYTALMEEFESSLRRVGIVTKTELKKAERLETQDLLVEIPYIVVAMTNVQAKHLFENEAALDGRERELFRRFKDELRSSNSNILDRYQPEPERDQWKVHVCPEKSFGDILDEVVAHRNDEHQKETRLKLRPISRSKEFFSSDKRSILAADWAREGLGMLLIIDSISLFHREIRKTLSGAEIITKEGVLTIVILPDHSLLLPKNKIIQDLLESELHQTLELYTEFKPCEIPFGDENSLKRWLNASIAQLKNMRLHPKPDKDAERNFSSNVRKDDGSLYKETGISSWWRKSGEME